MPLSRVQRKRVEFFYNYSTKQVREAILIEASGKAIEAWNKRVLILFFRRDDQLNLCILQSPGQITGRLFVGNKCANSFKRGDFGESAVP